MFIEAHATQGNPYYAVQYCMIKKGIHTTGYVVLDLLYVLWFGQVCMYQP